MHLAYLLVLSILLIGGYAREYKGVEEYKAYYARIITHIHQEFPQPPSPAPPPTQAAPTTIPTAYPRAPQYFTPVAANASQPLLIQLTDTSSTYFKEMLAVGLSGIIIAVLSLIFFPILLCCGCYIIKDREDDEDFPGFTWKERHFLKWLYVCFVITIIVGCIAIWIQSNQVNQRLTTPLDTPIQQVELIVNEGVILIQQLETLAANNGQDIPYYVTSNLNDIISIRSKLLTTLNDIDKYNNARNLYISIGLAIVCISALIAFVTIWKRDLCYFGLLGFLGLFGIVILWVGFTAHVVAWKAVKDTCQTPGQYNLFFVVEFQKCNPQDVDLMIGEIMDLGYDIVLNITNVAYLSGVTPPTIEQLLSVDVNNIIATTTNQALLSVLNPFLTDISDLQQYYSIINQLEVIDLCTSLTNTFFGQNENNICGEFQGSLGSLAVALAILGGSTMAMLIIGYLYFTRYPFREYDILEENGEGEGQGQEMGAM